MIQLRYAPELVEQAIRLAVRRDAAMESELHRAIDPIFEQPDDDERETRFRAVFVDWLKRLRLDRFLDETLSLFPLVVENVERAVVRAAPRRRAEGAELFVRSGCDGVGRTLVILLCPESVVDPPTVRDALLRELQHVEDMLDPGFGYEPQSVEGLPSRQQIVRERYCVLWDIRVEAKLVGSKLIERCCEPLLRGRFEKAFTVASTAPPPGAFERIWGNAPPHSELLTYANDPKLLHGVEASGGGTSLGAPCPVCGFPTFDWYAVPDDAVEGFASHVRDACAGWTPRDGICRQCAEALRWESESPLSPPRPGPPRRTQSC